MLIGFKNAKRGHIAYKDNFLSKKNSGFIEYIRELYYHCTFINPYNHYVCFKLNLQLQPSKQEFPPLFSSGFHDIEIEQFDRYFIEPFEEKERRLFLKERFLPC